MTIHRIVLENGEIIERPYTAEEIAELEKAQAEAVVKEAQATEAAAAKAALLAKLGITEEEAKLLLS